MTRLPGISTELAGAVRAVNAAYVRIPPRYRPAPAPWAALELEVEQACAAGNRRRALKAIEEWREIHLENFTLALLGAPLEEIQQHAKDES